MSRRGSKNPEKDVERWIRDEMASKVEVMMTNRHMLMIPFPIPAMDLYTSLWSPAQHLAMDTLRGTSLLKMYREFTIIGCPGPDGRGIRRVAVRLDEELPLPREKEMSFADLSDEQRAAVQAWIPEWLRYQQETNKVVELVKLVGRVCATYGQVVRLWPELQGFLGEWGAERVHKAKAKSPYPEAVLEWTEDTDQERMTSDGTLKEEFRPITFEPFSHMIAECLMLPEIEGIAHVARVLG